jgi:hypothetical protein
MLSLYKLYKNLIVESVTRDTVMSALTNHKRVNITYKDDDNMFTGKRYIEVYAYGTANLSKAPVIRAYQISGDTSTPHNSPGWRMFRLDKILTWEETNFTFYTPIHMRDREAPEYREPADGVVVGKDDSMDTVWATAKFDMDRKNNYEKKKNIENGTEFGEIEGDFE